MTEQAKTTTGRMAAGKVRWYDPQKGYGFVGVEAGEHAGRDFFVHRSQVEAPDQVLHDGQPVEFDIEHSRKGPVAVHVVPVGAPPPPILRSPAALAEALKHLRTAISILERESRRVAPEPAKGETA